MNREELADLIERFVSGEVGDWEWDDFTSIRSDDGLIEQVRQQANAIRDRFPPDDGHSYCSSRGVAELRRLAQDIRDSELRDSKLP